MSSPRDSAGVAVSRVLTMGVAGSLTMMAGGFLLALVRGGPIPAETTPLNGLAAGLGQGDARAFMSLGVLILLATPAARVVVLCWEFAKRREWAFVLISLTVLGVLGASVLIGRGE